MMRLMLGRNNTPSLLVTVDNDYNPEHFDFRVINGAWDGTYINGYVTVKECPSGDYSSLDKVEILTDNQDRLRSVPSYEYQVVFNNFDNPDYVAPEYKEWVPPPDWDDDIAF